MNESVFDVTVDTETSELLTKHPQSCEVFEKYNMQCCVCMGAGCGTLADCALMHGVDANILVLDIKEFLKRAESAEQ